MSKARLIKRLQWYYPTEKLHTYVSFPAIILYVIYRYNLADIVLLIYGLLVCIVILYQGQWYWKLKLDRLKGIDIDQEKNLHFFTSWKKRNPYLFMLMPLVFLIQCYLQAWTFSTNKMFIWGILANVFAILEHINYYYTQLMVDNLYDLKYIMKNKGLKKASLAKDLAEQNI